MIIMNLFIRNRRQCCYRLLTAHSCKSRLIYKRYTSTVSITYGIYIIVITILYYLFFKQYITTFLIPLKRPHDRNIISVLNTGTTVYPNSMNSHNFLLVTAASAQFIDRLENLIGSIHFHEPHIPIFIFDLGMTNNQRFRLSCIANIQTEQFPFENYPPHVSNLNIFAYKALMLKEIFEKYRYNTKAIFYLDAGNEIRSSLEPVIQKIQTQGYFLTRQKTLIFNHTDEHTFIALNMSKHQFSADFYYQTAGGMIGFHTNFSGFYNNVLMPFVNCSLNINCIAPISSRSSTTHRFDQSVLSILVYKAGYKVENEERFYGDFASPAELDATMILFSRRWHCPKVYASAVIFRSRCDDLSILNSRQRIRRIHEHSAVYTCGTLTIIKIRSFVVELPVYQVHMLIYIIYILIMSCIYCAILYMLSMSLLLGQTPDPPHPKQGIIMGYHLYYNTNPPRCDKVSQNYAYLFTVWHSSPYGG
ncbi:hypothetical protein I4U23_003910 [Adineta vaga]|nr:hypothetical protein I4U23_003910 [Adineta vaga]